MILLFLLAASWTAKYPADKFIVGHAKADTAESARVNAAADVARTISVRIESQLTDRFQVSGGQEKQQIDALSKASTDVHLTGLRFESADGEELAILERAPAAAEERRLRDVAVADARARLAAEGKGEGEALKDCLVARTLLTEALRHDTLARAILPGADGPDLSAAARGVEERLSGLLKKPQTNLTEAVEALAFQLRQQGLGAGSKLTVPPFTYRTTIYPSLFGRAAAQELERALASSAAQGDSGEVLVHGTYTEEKDGVRLIVVARQPQTGKSLGSAEASVPKKAIPADLPLTPPNLMQALRDQKILALGEEVPGALKVELFTNKQDAGGSQVFFEKEELKLFVRVSKPAWVRIIYLLQNGAKAPLTQGWYLDEGKVNHLVEFPDAFEISRPFGSEHIQAVAFTEKPAPLPVKKAMIDGSEYDVVDDDTSALVKHRGFIKKAAAAETSEAVVTLTTMPR